MNAARPVPTRRYVIALAALLATGLLLRLWLVRLLPVGVMEVDQLEIGRALRGAAADLPYLAAARHGPLWPLLLRGVVDLFGPGTWALRLPAVVISIAAVPLLLLTLGSSWSRGEKIWITLLLLAWPWYFTYSRNARPYMAHFWLVTFAVVFLTRLAETGRGRDFAAFVVLCPVAAINHLMAGFFFAAAGVAVLVHYRTAPHFRRAFAALVVAALVCVPWLIALREGLQPPADLKHGVDASWWLLFIRRASGGFLPLGVVAAVVLCGWFARPANDDRLMAVPRALAAPFGCAADEPARRRVLWLLTWLLLAPPVAVTLLSLTPFKPARLEYLLPCLLAPVLLLAHGLARWRPRQAAVVAATLLATFALTTYQNLQWQFQPGKHETANLRVLIRALRELPVHVDEIWVYPSWAAPTFRFHAAARHIAPVVYRELDARHYSAFGKRPYCVLAITAYELHNQAAVDLPLLNTANAYRPLIANETTPEWARLSCVPAGYSGDVTLSR